ncbi:MAG: GDSL-type esterase/lipase family protein [Leptospiraceae bacterium]
MKKFLIYFAVILITLGLLYLATHIWILEQVHALPENNPANCKSLEGKKRILLVGDSITHGTVSFNYADLLQKRLGDDFEVINAGINSNLSHNVRRRMPELLNCNADVITILIGTNDVNSTLHPEFLENYQENMGIHGTPNLAQYRENVNQIVDEFQSRDGHTRIALISLPVIGENLDSEANTKIQKYSQALKEISNARGVVYLPLNEMLREYLEGRATSENQCDEPHTLIEESVAAHYLFGKDYNNISRSNGFFLVTDCLHLNETAGKILADLIVEFIESDHG